MREGGSCFGETKKKEIVESKSAAERDQTHFFFCSPVAMASTGDGFDRSDATAAIAGATAAVSLRGHAAG